MPIRVMTQEDLDYLAEHGVKDKDRKIRAGESEHNYALVIDGVTMGIAGFKFINDTTAFCWLCPCTEWTSHLTESFRALSEWIPTFCKDFGVRRLEAYVEVGFEAGKRLVEHLNFEFEHRKNKFIGNNPADCYVRFFDEKQDGI